MDKDKVLWALPEVDKKKSFIKIILVLLFLKLTNIFVKYFFSSWGAPPKAKSATALTI